MSFEKRFNESLSGMGILVFAILIVYGLSKFITLNGFIWFSAALIHVGIVGFMVIMARSSIQSVWVWGILGALLPIMGLFIQFIVIYYTLPQAILKSQSDCLSGSGDDDVFTPY